MPHHARHDMHTQQRSVYAHHQQEAVAYAYAELQLFNRVLWYCLYYTITFAKQMILCWWEITQSLSYSFVPNLILTPIEYIFTMSQSQVLKVLDAMGIVYKSSKLSANISINTYYMHMLYLLVIPTSKESASDHEAEILPVLPQVSIYPLIRRGKSEGNCRIEQKKKHCFLWQTVQRLMGTLHLQVFHQKVPSGSV